MDDDLLPARMVNEFVVLPAAVLPGVDLKARRTWWCAEFFELGVQSLSRFGGQHGPLSTPGSFLAEGEVSVVEQVMQGFADVVRDATAVVDQQALADEDDVASADPPQREQLAQFGWDREGGSAHPWCPFRSASALPRRRPSSSP